MSEEVSDRPTTINEQPDAVDGTVAAEATDATATEEKADTDTETDSGDGRLVGACCAGVGHPATLLTLVGVAAFTIVFGRLGVTHYRNFGLVVVRHGHLRPGVLAGVARRAVVRHVAASSSGRSRQPRRRASAPFYWLGAGPSFLYVAQAFALGLGAASGVLIARYCSEPVGRPRLRRRVPLYAPIEWITGPISTRPSSSRRSCSCGTSPDGGRGAGTSSRSSRTVDSRGHGAGCVRAGRRAARLVLAQRRPSGSLRGLATIGSVWSVRRLHELVIPTSTTDASPSTRVFSTATTAAASPRSPPTWPSSGPGRSDATQPDRLRFYRDLCCPSAPPSPGRSSC